MTDFWNQPGIPLGLEARLRAKAAVPDAGFARAVTARIEASEQASGRAGVRLVVGGTVTAAVVGAIALSGGLGYAPAAVRDAALAVSRVAVSTTSDRRDAEPPLRREASSAPATARIVDGGVAAVVSTRIAVTGRAVVAVSVVDRHGRKLLLTQSSRRGGSIVGVPLRGPQTKTIRQVLRVPGTLPVRLRVPANLLQPGRSYWVVLHARSADGNVASLTIPFRL